jgi:hypothetical protein
MSKPTTAKDLYDVSLENAVNGAIELVIIAANQVNSFHSSISQGDLELMIKGQFGHQSTQAVDLESFSYAHRLCTIQNRYIIAKTL